MKYEILIDELTKTETIKRTDENSQVWFIPSDPANSDYQAYLNKDKPQVEHLTEIPTKETYDATLASELSNPSTPQAGE